MPARTRIPKILFCVLAYKKFFLQEQQWVVPTHILNQSWNWLVALSSYDLAAGISLHYSTLFHAGWCTLFMKVLDEGSRMAVALAVAETLNIASSEILALYNLDPSRLAKHLLAHPVATQHFNETEKLLFQRTITESCEYIVDIASQLPTFTERTFAEILKREGQLLEIAKETLGEVQRMREYLNPLAQASHFELEYRRAVIRNLDVLELFGTDVSTASRRHRLSVAYVSLSIEQSSLSASHEDFSMLPTADKVDQCIVSVDESLVSSRRLLICGVAGSGKTTLLQWIAVKSASQSFTGRLSDWNNTFPFYIRLRHYAQQGLPAPEVFPRLVTSIIADVMPKGWAHAILTSGRAIVLVDGLDEVPTLRREDVRSWLKELVETFPQAYFIITSRPHAVKEGWMDQEGFNNAELQPMELPEINTFIDHWHEAVSFELHEEKEKAELASLAKHLKKDLEQNHSKRNLATSPLLCAMLCALNRDRRQQLPSDRIELYEACCSMLLERRDKEQGIDLSVYPAAALNYRQKRVFLEDLAYWMIKNGWSEVELPMAEDHFSRKIQNIQAAPQNISSVDICRFFIERSGLIREPIPGYIDFTHKTFQEFLAARAASDEMDIGLLVRNAYNDQWHEVIILSAGLASRPMREKLLLELIARGDAEDQNRHQIHLLAVSCLEASVDLGQEVKKEVERRLAKLVPPKNLTAAKELASASELVVPHLFNRGHHSASIAAACIRTLALIASNTALDAIEGYTDDNRPLVISEILKAWDSFDREAYAKRILLKVFQGKHSIQLGRPSSLNGIHFLAHITSLHIESCALITDLSPLSSLTKLIKLHMSICTYLSDLSPLARLTQLTELSLADGERIKDLSSLTALTQLTQLNIWRCHRISLSSLVKLTQLTKLKLFGRWYMSDLSPLASLTQLIDLDLSNCKQLSDLSPLANLTQLTKLTLSSCEKLNDLSPLANLTQLTELDLRGIKQAANFSGLSPRIRISGQDLKY